MSEPDFAYTRILEDADLESAEQWIRKSLAAQGFGVLTEIDIRSVLKAKLDVDHPPYRILGACNPKLAHRALTAEPHIGLMLPCNVVVRALREGGVEVSVVKPEAMLGVVESAALADIATEADAGLRVALNAPRD